MPIDLSIEVKGTRTSRRGGAIVALLHLHVGGRHDRASLQRSIGHHDRRRQRYVGRHGEAVGHVARRETKLTSRCFPVHGAVPPDRSSTSRNRPAASAICSLGTLTDTLPGEPSDPRCRIQVVDRIRRVKLVAKLRRILGSLPPRRTSESSTSQRPSATPPVSFRCQP